MYCGGLPRSTKYASQKYFVLANLGLNRSPLRETRLRQSESFKPAGRWASVTMSMSRGSRPPVISTFSTKLPSIHWKPSVTPMLRRSFRYSSKPPRSVLRGALVPNLRTRSTVLALYGDRPAWVFGPKAGSKGGNTPDWLNCGIMRPPRSVLTIAVLIIAHVVPTVTQAIRARQVNARDSAESCTRYASTRWGSAVREHRRSASRFDMASSANLCFPVTAKLCFPPHLVRISSKFARLSKLR